MTLKNLYYPHARGGVSGGGGWSTAERLERKERREERRTYLHSGLENAAI